MLHRFAVFVPSIVVAPLMMGIGIGIGAVAAAGAATIVNAVQPALTVITCATTGACATVTNTHGGTAVLASSPNGLGVRGLSSLSVGVTGESIASIGVNGKSVNGNGVHGASVNADAVVGISSGSGTSAGVVGANTSDSTTASGAGGPGVRATSLSGSGLVVSNGPDPYGIFGIATTPTASIDAQSTFGDALDIYTGQQSTHDYPSAGPGIVTLSQDGTTTNIGAGEEAISVINALERTSGGYGPPGDGIFGSSTYGSGVVGSTESGPTATTGLGGVVPISAVVANADKGADLYLGFGTGTFEVTSDGSVNASGTVTSGVTCAPTTCPTSTVLRAYATREASPTIEDVGRAQLVNGGAGVTFDPAFAGAIDATRGYSVFITPEGETRGLYVAARTARGFSVAENMAGHSTVTFSYRIVATPYGSTALRLPVNYLPRSRAAAFARQQTIIDAMRHRAATARSRMARPPKLAKPPATK